MCIIIVKPKEKTLEKKLLKHCWDKNNDGGGFAFAENDKIKVYKELEDFDKFWKLYETHVVKPRAAKDKTKTREEAYNVLLHFRIGTSGEVSRDNIHPFIVNTTYAFAHNGIITNLDMTANSPFSDTYVFNELIKDLPLHWMKNKSQRILVRSFIGSGSKLAFLDKRGAVNMIREEKGDWDLTGTGCWFSNTSYKGWDWVARSGYHTPDVDSPGLGYSNRGGAYHAPDRTSCYPNNVLPIPFNRQAESLNRTFDSLQRLGPSEDTVVETVTIVNKKSAYNEDVFGSCGFCGMIIYSKHEIENKRCSFCTNLNKIAKEREVENQHNLH